jgi:protein O-mannosyl-transferase
MFFSGKRDRVLGLMLLAVTLFAYRPAWNGLPVWDDDMHMTRPELRSAAGLARIWTQPGAVQQYYPLTHSVFWLEYHLFGDSTFGYHLLTILLHACSALLLVTLLRRLGIPGAWLAGALFALHPVQVESVAWITELKNTLSGLFYLSAALAYLKFDSERKKKHYAIALLLFFFGLLSKSVIVTLPAALLVVVWWKQGKIEWKRDIVPLSAFFAAGIFSGVFTAWVELRFSGAAGGEFGFTFLDRCLIAGRAFWFYLCKLLWPADLIFIYPRWHIDAQTFWQYLFPAAFLLAAALFWSLRNRSRAPLAVLLYYAATLFPAVGFFNVYPFKFSFVADHFQYLACIGPLAAAASCIDRGTGLWQEKLRRTLRPLLYGTLVSALFLLSFNRSRMYSNVETLYRTTIRDNPACWMARNNLGIVLMNRGRTDEALAQCRMALASNPAIADIHNTLGLLLAQKGRTDEAIAHYRKSLDINPMNGGVHCNLGNMLAQTGRNDEAAAQYRTALQLDPAFAPAFLQLGAILLKTGLTGEAITQYQKGLELDPYNAEARCDLGKLLAGTGRPEEAFIQFRKALEIRPDFADAYNNLGILLARTGQTDQAISCFRKVVEINPAFGNAYYNLGNALIKAGRTEEAAACYRKTLEMIPVHIAALENLAEAYTRQNKLTDAIQCLKKAVTPARAAGQLKEAAEITARIERLSRTRGSLPPQR